MALKYQTLKKRETEAPLSDHENMLVDRMEAYVDKQIQEQWTRGKVEIPLLYAKFEMYIDGSYAPINEFRRKIMFDLLEYRFKQADWNCKEVIDTTDSMNSQDYWVLTPKKK